MTAEEYFKTYINYALKTTFWMDFTIADRFGIAAIKDTYHRAFNDWKGNHEYFTELVLILNHKSWQWSEKNSDICQVYVDAYEEAYEWGLNNLKGEALTYFIKTLD